MPDGTTPTTHAATDKRLVSLIDQVSERLNRFEVGDALGLLAQLRKRITAPAQATQETATPSSRAGFEYCQDCGNFIKDRGEVVGHHLYNCKAAKPVQAEPQAASEDSPVPPITHAAVPVEFRDGVLSFLQDMENDLEGVRRVATVIGKAIEGLNTDYSEEFAAVIREHIDDGIYRQRERLESMIEMLNEQPVTPSN